MFLSSIIVPNFTTVGSSLTCDRVYKHTACPQVQPKFSVQIVR